MNVVLAIVCLFAAQTSSLGDGEIWNNAVDAYSAGDVTNALREARTLMRSKEYRIQAASLVARIEMDRGRQEEAAYAAQEALRADPKNECLQRNFSLATENMIENRANRHIDEVLKSSQGKDIGGLLKSAVTQARSLYEESGNFKTNTPTRVVALADDYSERALKLSDVWIPLRSLALQVITNEEQKAALAVRIDQAEDNTRRVAKEFADLDAGVSARLSLVEGELTEFLKSTIDPPSAMSEDLIAQSNAWKGVETINGREWQSEALDYTRAFRARLPMWIREYERQSQADTNLVAFSAEAQAKIASLATDLEKVQLDCRERTDPLEQKRAIEIIERILDLLPKNNNAHGSHGSSGQSPPKPQDNSGEAQDDSVGDEFDKTEEGERGLESGDDKDDRLEEVLKRAQERNDEHEARKTKLMRKASLPPNERDW